MSLGWIEKKGEEGEEEREEGEGRKMTFILTFLVSSAAETSYSLSTVKPGRGVLFLLGEISSLSRLSSLSWRV